ncbi:MAG: cupin-like domain-containing protein [Myxococcales bacterium]
MTEVLAGKIDVRDRLSYTDFINEYAKAQRPVVIRNAFPEWKALGKWSPEFFRSEHGHRTVTLGGKSMKMGDYIKSVEAATPDKPAPYLRECVIREFAPELGEDLQPFVQYALPNWLRGYYPDWGVDHHMNRASEPELFIGGPGTRLERRVADEQGAYAGVHGAFIQGYADLHYDPSACPVLLCQVYGKKGFWMFDPVDTPYLYADGRLSRIPNLENPDFERFPLFKKATPIRFVQEPGEAVYVPEGWWHATRMVSISIAVSSTFANLAHWEGVAKEVLHDYPSETRKKLLHAFLLADGKLKSFLGDRFGENHFQERKLRNNAAALKRTIKKLLGRETPEPAH